MKNTKIVKDAPKGRNLIAMDLLTNGVYRPKTVKPRKGKGSYDRKGRYDAHA